MRKRKTHRPYTPKEPLPFTEPVVLAALVYLSAPPQGSPVTANEVAAHIRKHHPRQHARRAITHIDLMAVRKTLNVLVADGAASECAERPALTGRRARMYAATIPTDA